LMIVACRLMRGVVGDRMEAKGGLNSDCWRRNARCSDGSFKVVILCYLGGKLCVVWSCASSCASLCLALLLCFMSTNIKLLFSSSYFLRGAMCLLVCHWMPQTFFMSKPLVDIKLYLSQIESTINLLRSIVDLRCPFKAWERSDSKICRRPGSWDWQHKKIALPSVDIFCLEIKDSIKICLVLQNL
jgi:hypothetical protein